MDDLRTLSGDFVDFVADFMLCTLTLLKSLFRQLDTELTRGRKKQPHLSAGKVRSFLISFSSLFLFIAYFFFNNRFDFLCNILIPETSPTSKKCCSYVESVFLCYFTLIILFFLQTFFLLRLCRSCTIKSSKPVTTVSSVNNATAYIHPVNRLTRMYVHTSGHISG